jgi:hypothetical protein
MAFLGYFEQLCAAAIVDDAPMPAPLSLWSRLCAPFERFMAWFDAPLFDETK